MAVHITRAHGVRIGHTTAADITVAKVDGGIHVTMQPRFLQRVDPGMMLHVLALPEPETTLTPDEYAAFLGKLHGYLMLTPPKPAPPND
jgi:hypothetical protein